MYKFTPASWGTPALCDFDERATLVKYTTQTEIGFIDQRLLNDRAPLISN